MSLTPLIPHHHIPSLAHVAQPHGGSSPSPRHAPCLSAPTSLTAAPFFVGAAADDDDKPTTSADIGFFLPASSAVLLPLLLQNPALALHCHCQ